MAKKCLFTGDGRKPCVKIGCGTCDFFGEPASLQQPECVPVVLNDLLSCAHCGGTIDHRALLGEVIFSCSNCYAETRFKKEGLTIEKQMEKFKHRAR
ncbi:MAG: hypothetical protein OEV73_00195 [Desulfobulbaceae bacterium]|nr:hypothetical protein [Desulfobulbaceae bacterium]